MKIVAGISGGVDSAIAAYILKKEGHEIVDTHFDFLSMKEFHDTVIKYFVSEYKIGHTPNPCAYCNGTMKLRLLYEKMKETKSDMIATGHYASVGKYEQSNGIRYYIKKSKNEKKDQSYMLYTLSQDILSHLMLPIGDMDKDDVRTIARRLNLPMADDKDSQDICFIKDIDYVEYIKQYDFGKDYKEKIARGELSEKDICDKPYLKKGEFVDSKGNVLGFHEGIINYTIGQRKGLNISFGERRFVLSIDVEKNQVVLGTNDELYSSDFKIKNIVFQKVSSFDDMKKTINDYPLAKLRYRHDGTRCEIKDISDGVMTCHLIEPVRAITRGQAAVFYDDEGDILFGGTIV